jgi:predicted GNAT superfamily acetyltransferase
MTGVRAQYQSIGIGAKLKWAQRERALSEGVKYIKWTFEPVKARNAYFNLEKLGAIVQEYMPNFYGIDYATSAMSGSAIGLRSDRLFAEWHLDSPKVSALAAGEEYFTDGEPDAVIQITKDWHALVKEDSEQALAVQDRIRGEFEAAFGKGLIARGFLKDAERPAYLLYEG